MFQPKPEKHYQLKNLWFKHKDHVELCDVTLTKKFYGADEYWNYKLVRCPCGDGARVADNPKVNSGKESQMSLL